MDEKEVTTVPAQNIESAPASASERLSDADMLALERAQNKRSITLLTAKNATLEAEAADLMYKNLIMQFFLKHELKEDDGINPDGTLVRRAKGE